MAVRLRRVNGALVALCAARSAEKPGDVYLDDEQHMALARKVWLDYPQLGLQPEEWARAATDAEESNNENRDWWDRTYAPPPAEGA